jgi:hypothetical protein
MVVSAGVQAEFDNMAVHLPPVTLGPAAGLPNVEDLVAHFDKRADFAPGWRRFQDFEGSAVLLYALPEKDWKMRRTGAKAARRNAQQRLAYPMRQTTRPCTTKTLLAPCLSRLDFRPEAEPFPAERDAVCKHRYPANRNVIHPGPVSLSRPALYHLIYQRQNRQRGEAESNHTTHPPAPRICTITLRLEK